MTLARQEIVTQLIDLVGQDQVVTDETVLQESSVDRFRRFEAFHGIFQLPMPAAVVQVNSTQDVAKVLEFANANKKLKLDA